jgi:hypothetical protein
MHLLARVVENRNMRSLKQLQLFMKSGLGSGVVCQNKTFGDFYLHQTQPRCSFLVLGVVCVVR